MPPVVILDTSVLFAPTLRDTLLRCAELKLYSPRWSPDILQELRKSLVEDARLSVQSVDRLLQAMSSHFADASVDGYQGLVNRMTNHRKDRHVLAAAIHAQADTLVTLNLKDFSPSHAIPHGVAVQSPDDFLMRLATASPATLHTVITMQANAKRRPPTTALALLTRLEGPAPDFARFMKTHMALEQPEG